MSRIQDAKDGRDVLTDRTAERAFKQARLVDMELVLEVERELTGRSAHDARLYLHNGGYGSQQPAHELTEGQERRLLADIRKMVETRHRQWADWRMPLNRAVHLPMAILHRLRGVQGCDFSEASQWVYDHQAEIARAIEDKLPEILDSIVRTEQFQAALALEVTT